MVLELPAGRAELPITALGSLVLSAGISPSSITYFSSTHSVCAGVWEGDMKLPRRKFLHLAAGAVALPAVSRIATAQPSEVATKRTRVVTLGTRSGPTPDLNRAQ